jgi:hypothetical protein
VALKEPRKAMGSVEKVWTIKSFGNLQCPLGEPGAEVVVLNRATSISTIC